MTTAKKLLKNKLTNFSLDEQEQMRRLKSFKEVTGGITPVIVNPRLTDTKNITETSKEVARNYLVKASNDLSRRKDDYAKSIQQGKEPKFRDVFRKIANRAAGVQRANCRDK